MHIKSPIVKKFLHRKVSVIALIILLIFVFAAIFGPGLCSRSPYEQDVSSRFSGISKDHWLGCDYAGRDIFTRVIYGARLSMSLSFSSVAIGMVIGVSLGLLGGYYGGFIDGIISRFAEILMALPGLVIGLLIVSILGTGDTNAIIAVAIITIPSFVRITRSSVITLKDSEFVQSSLLAGASDLRIIVTHILPNCISLILVNYTLNIGTAVITAASLSFIGFGAQAPEPEWGLMLSAGFLEMRTFPIGILAPGLAITSVVICTSLIGDGIRDAFDV